MRENMRSKAKLKVTILFAFIIGAKTTFALDLQCRITPQTVSVGNQFSPNNFWVIALVKAPIKAENTWYDLGMADNSWSKGYYLTSMQAIQTGFDLLIGYAGLPTGSDCSQTRNMGNSIRFVRTIR
jgi:hypothetical protein